MVVLCKLRFYFNNALYIYAVQCIPVVAPHIALFSNSFLYKFHSTNKLFWSFIFN